MSNAFDKLMAKGAKSSGKSTSGGRPTHEHWEGYQRIVTDSKVSAKCLNCLKTFANTAKVRLAKHR